MLNSTYSLDFPVGNIDIWTAYNGVVCKKEFLLFYQRVLNYYKTFCVTFIWMKKKTITSWPTNRNIFSVTGGSFVYENSRDMGFYLKTAPHAKEKAKQNVLSINNLVFSFWQPDPQDEYKILGQVSERGQQFDGHSYIIRYFNAQKATKIWYDIVCPAWCTKHLFISFSTNFGISGSNPYLGLGVVSPKQHNWSSLAVVKHHKHIFLSEVNGISNSLIFVTSTHFLLKIERNVIFMQLCFRNAENKGAVVMPVSAEKLQDSDGALDSDIWRIVCPENYQALSDFALPRGELPDYENIACVHQEFLTEVERFVCWKEKTTVVGFHDTH